MKLHIFGSLSGTEPMPGRHHTAWALEKDGELYWFDAGEGCAHTCGMLKLDPRKAKHIFISHPHIDHVGGLPNLLEFMQKLNYLEEKEATEIEIFTGAPEVIAKGVDFFSACNDDSGRVKAAITPIAGTGVIFDDGKVKVECCPNGHMVLAPDGHCCSYSYRITAEGKKIIFSGDVASYHDFDCFLNEGCDWLLMESGHHSPPALCAAWKEEKRSIGQILFVHHGREILRDPRIAKERCELAWGKPVFIAEDAQTFEI